MSEIDSVEEKIHGYFHQRTARNYIRLLDTPRIWGLPFGQGIMPQSWARQNDFEVAVEEVMQRAMYRCDLASLNSPDPDWGGIVLSAMDAALSKRMDRTESTQYRFLFGQTPLYPVTEPPNYTLFKQALIRLVRDRVHEWEKPPEIWLGRFYRLREGLLSAIQLKVFGGGSGIFGSDETKMTWNHSKIIASDGVEALVGGHNLNMDLFRSYPPVHDVSAVVHGPGAAGAQEYLDQLWAVNGDLLSQEKLDLGKLAWVKQDPARSRPRDPLADPDVIPWVRREQVRLVAWHDSDPQPPPPPRPPAPPSGDFRTRDLEQVDQLTEPCYPPLVGHPHPPYAALTEYKKTTGMLAVGKYWRGSTDFQNASELMKKQLILGARRTIKMSQMDLISAWKKYWSDHVVCQWLIQALLANKHLTVEIVVSPLDAGAGAEGDQYSFGSGAVRTFDLIKYYMTHDVQTDRVLPDLDGARAEALTRLFVAPMYYTDAVPHVDTVEGETYKWPDLTPEGYTKTLKQPMLSQKPPHHGVIGSAALSVLSAAGYRGKPVPSAPGNHAKVMIVDDEAYIVGSDNLYPGSLSEFNYLVEGADAVNELLHAYWNPLWRYSGPHAISGPRTSVRVGPAGSSGTRFEDTSTSRIAKVDVYAGQVIDGIHATHEDGTTDPLRGSQGGADPARRTTVTFDEVDPLVGVSGEWGTWHGQACVTRLRFHRRSGRDSELFGSRDGVTNRRTFDLRAPDTERQEVVSFFGSTTLAEFGFQSRLGAIGIVVR